MVENSPIEDSSELKYSSAKITFQRKYAEIVSENPVPFQPSDKKRKRVRVRELEDGKTVAAIGDLDTWQSYYDKQAKLEQLRLYFCVIGWQLLAKVYPNHKVFKLYRQVIESPEYIKHQLEIEEVDVLSLSLSSMGKIPQYHVLGLNNSNILDNDLTVKNEPLDDSD